MYFGSNIELYFSDDASHATDLTFRAAWLPKFFYIDEPMLRTAAGRGRAFFFAAYVPRVPGSTVRLRFTLFQTKVMLTVAVQYRNIAAYARKPGSRITSFRKIFCRC
jgi:hypothetical protein